VNFENRCVVVTGASRGLGRGCALAFAAARAEVILVARPSDELAQVEAEIRDAGGAAQAMPCGPLDLNALSGSCRT